jgi:general stress protein YciG
MPDDNNNTSNRGFASMDDDKQREIASKGGQSVPDEKRSFSQDRELAAEAGRKGGEASGGGNRQGGDGGQQNGGDGGQQNGGQGNQQGGQRGGSGNFANDRERASEAGRKGGQA